MSEQEVTVQFHLEGFQEKLWSNPSKTSHRVYIHKIDGEQKIECGYLDTVGISYRGPDKRRKHADHNVVLCEEKEIGEGLVHLATVTIGEDNVDLHYQDNEGNMKSIPSTDAKQKKEKKEEIPAPVVDEGIEDSVQENVLEHIASITQCDTKITISYGNTVEVKSRNRGYIQAQYPKFSLSVELEGGNVMSKIHEAADAVVKTVEDKLTEIINEMSDKR